MPIRLSCSCGKTLNVDEKYRGKKAKCPACGQVLLVDDAPAKTKQPTSAAIAPRKTSGIKSGKPKDDVAERKPTKMKAPAKKSNKGLILAGLGTLLFISCCGTGVLAYLYLPGYLSQKATQIVQENLGPKQGADGPKNELPKNDDDMKLIHEGAIGFMTVRPADVWKNPAVQDQLKLIDDNASKGIAELESEAGLKIDDIERVTLLVRTAELPKPEFAVLVMTRKPVDRKKIVSMLGKGSKKPASEVKHGAETIYVIPGDVALCFPSDRLILACEKDTVVKDVLDRAKTPTTNPTLRRGVEMALSGKHQLVAAAELKKNLTDQIPPDFVKQAPSIPDIAGVILTGTLSNELALESILAYASADLAGKAKKDADGLVALGRVILRNQKEPPAGLVKFADSIEVTQRSADVVLKGSLNPDVKDLGVLQLMGAPGRVRSINNLKLIALAMNNFHDANGSLPNHAILDPKTKAPLLSWRVALLPYLDQGELYKQIHLDEPWNSKHNKQFRNKMPDCYRLPTGKPLPDMTFYQVFHGKETVFPDRLNDKLGMASGVSMLSISDGVSNTVAVVEAQNPVNWMKPDDIPFASNQKGLMARVGNHWGNDTFHGAMLDATVYSFSRKMPDDVLGAAITRNGNEPPTFFDFMVR